MAFVGFMSVLNGLGKDENDHLTFNGKMVGGGIQTVETPSALNANASNGSVAIALADDMPDEISWPIQSGGEEVRVDVYGKSLSIGTPSYDENDLDAAIAALSTPLGIIHVQGDDIELGVLPVVTDISDNDYVDAGATLSADGCIVAANSTKKYMIFVDSAPGFVNPELFVSVDSDHISAPLGFVYSFENLSMESAMGITGLEVSEGWNMIRCVVDTATHSDLSNFTTETCDINSCISIPKLELSTKSGEEETIDTARSYMTLEGVNAYLLLRDIVVAAQTEGLRKGLYIKFNDNWCRCTMD